MFTQYFPTEWSSSPILLINGTNGELAWLRDQLLRLEINLPVISLWSSERTFKLDIQTGDDNAHTFVESGLRLVIARRELLNVLVKLQVLVDAGTPGHHYLDIEDYPFHVQISLNEY